MVSILYFMFPFTLASCLTYNIENQDGSYSIGLNADSRNDMAHSLIALLSKSAGYTTDQDYDQIRPNGASVEEPEVVLQESNLAESKNLLTPHLEILELIEVFLKFKGEIASRFRALYADNSDLIQSVFQTVVSKIGTLHSFTLLGIRILRQVLELAVNLMAQWQVNVPGFSLGLNLGGATQGGHSQSSSFSVNKNTNLFGRK